MMLLERSLHSRLPVLKSNKSAQEWPVKYLEMGGVYLPCPLVQITNSMRYSGQIEGLDNIYDFSSHALTSEKSVVLSRAGTYFCLHIY